MPMIAFSIPIATDKTELFRNAHTRFVPARREEFEASRRRLGIAAELGFLQHTPAGDVAIVIFDVSDPTHMLAGTDRAQDISPSETPRRMPAFRSQTVAVEARFEAPAWA